ncbi:MAG: DNA repair protein RadC [Candidatus Thermoplasmatota archaeon]|nr:DNA repair protein RadC [Candidatus Thermoplasmatota archaeon]
MRIREMPWFERPGARLRRQGAEALSDAELLAVVLGRGSRAENVLDCCRRVLAEQNLDKLAGLSVPELSRLFGGDEVKALRVAAVSELFRRLRRLQSRGFTQQISCAQDVYHWFAARLADKKKEHFYCLCLDTKHRVIAEQLVSVGILDASLIHPREVFAPAIACSAHAVILVHNHPSGAAEPSVNDKEVTELLIEAGRMIGIEVLDHIIVGKECFSSMKDEGLMEG